MINKIIDETNVKIDIDNDGIILIAAEDIEKGQRAIDLINNIVKDVEVGDIYTGKVVRIVSLELL